MALYKFTKHVTLIGLLSPLLD